MLYLPEQDGITHINVYSRGATEIGRMLSNFYYSPFIYQPYGKFNSVEGFWYWWFTGQQHEQFRVLSGWGAKQEGKKYRDDRIDKSGGISDEDKRVVLEAIRCKLRQNKIIQVKLKQSCLPFSHYYAYGDKVVRLPEYDWMLDEFERIRNILKTYKGRSK